MILYMGETINRLENMIFGDFVVDIIVFVSVQMSWKLTSSLTDEPILMKLHIYWSKLPNATRILAYT